MEKDNRDGGAALVAVLVGFPILALFLAGPASLIFEAIVGLSGNFNIDGVITALGCTGFAWFLCILIHLSTWDSIHPRRRKKQLALMFTIFALALIAGIIAFFFYQNNLVLTCIALMVVGISSILADLALLSLIS